jgi:uncharacterized linocin/CFP29 family protein
MTHPLTTKRHRRPRLPEPAMDAAFRIYQRHMTAITQIALDYEAQGVKEKSSKSAVVRDAIDLFLATKSDIPYTDGETE